jgi:hypothetical protein
MGPATESRPHTGFPTVEYQFRLVAKNDPGSSTSRAIPNQPDVVIENKSEVTNNSKPDLYTELLKLEDLHKRGLLTDAEFQEQKKRLLQ